MSANRHEDPYLRIGYRFFKCNTDEAIVLLSLFRTVETLKLVGISTMS